jgi:hypothetical protein
MAYTVETVQDRWKMLLAYEEKTMVAPSTGDGVSGLGRPLAAEIDKSPLFDCRKKSLITRERYTLDPKHVLNTMVSLSFDDVTSGLGRPLAVEVTILQLHKIQKTNITTEWCRLD